MKKLILFGILVLFLAPVIAEECDYKFLPNVLPYEGHIIRTIKANENATINLTSDGGFTSFPSPLMFNNTTSIDMRINMSIQEGTIEKYYIEHIFLNYSNGTKANITFCFGINFSIEDTNDLKEFTDEELMDEFLRRIGKGEKIIGQNITERIPVVWTEGVYDLLQNCNPHLINETKSSLNSCKANTKFLQKQNDNLTSKITSQLEDYEARVEKIKKENISPMWLAPFVFMSLCFASFIVIRGRFGTWI